MSNTEEMKIRITEFEERHPVLFGVFAGAVLMIPLSLLVGLFWFSSWVLHFVIRG